jgi:hypothetical protein
MTKMNIAKYGTNLLDSVQGRQLNTCGGLEMTFFVQHFPSNGSLHLRSFLPTLE